MSIDARMEERKDRQFVCLATGRARLYLKPEEARELAQDLISLTEQGLPADEAAEKNRLSDLVDTARAVYRDVWEEKLQQICEGVSGGECSKLEDLPPGPLNRVEEGLNRLLQFTNTATVDLCREGDMLEGGNEVVGEVHHAGDTWILSVDDDDVFHCSACGPAEGANRAEWCEHMRQLDYHLSDQKKMNQSPACT